MLPLLALALSFAVASAAPGEPAGAPPLTCQGFVLGEDRNEVARRLSDAGVPFTGNTPGARVFFVNGVLDPETSGGAEYLRLVFDASERLQAVEANWLAETPPAGKGPDPRFTRLLQQLTKSYGSPKRWGSADFEWRAGPVEVRLYEKKLAYKDPKKLEPFVILRHALRPVPTPAAR